MTRRSRDVSPGAASPFATDAVVSGRIAALTDRLAGSVAARVTRDGRMPVEDVDALIAAHALRGPDEVMLLALPGAAARADPPISGYRVGAVGREEPGGDLIIGANLEFPGADLGMTIHAEGMVAIRAFARGTAISVLAIAQARPCAHCRQTLTEFDWASDLRLIDPAAHSVSLAALYPWPFTPADLSEAGSRPGAVAWPELAIDDPSLPADVAARLVRTGRRAHTPYSRCPAAVVLRLTDGRLVAGATLESVAYNPTISPIQVAMAMLRSGGDGYPSIESAYLAARVGGPVDDVQRTRALLHAVAPDVPLITVAWT